LPTLNALAKLGSVRDADYMAPYNTIKIGAANDWIAAAICR
jgi:hypothetical protein